MATRWYSGKDLFSIVRLPFDSSHQVNRHWLKEREYLAIYIYRVTCNLISADFHQANRTNVETYYSSN